LQHLQKEDVELACVCQRRADDLSAADRFGVRAYTDAYEMARTECLDGVVIAVPTHLHLPVVLACLAGARKRQEELGEERIGLQAFLVEKPVAENLSAAIQLVEAAEKAGVKVLVGHQRRHSAFVTKARELVTNSNFGPLRGMNAEFALLKPDHYFAKEDSKLEWRSKKGSGGPVLINLIHDIDLLRYITGHEIVSVFAVTSGSARENEVEDTGAVTVVLDHGAVGTFFFSDAAPSPWSYEFTTLENRKYPIVPGVEARDCYHFLGAQCSLGFPSMRTFRYGQDVQVPGWDSPLSVAENAVEREDPLTAQMAHFVRVCRDDEPLVCSGRDALESLAVIMAILKSAETRTAVCPGDMFKASAQRSTPEAKIKSVGYPEKYTRYSSTSAASTSAIDERRSDLSIEAHV
jgi:predicted dehydrogenase